ncbi:MAG: 4Fe-4S binding protein, partial [Candidatus Thermoplasmatota archaeon]|nr:4Fe-4S binding protein [Candidatus Thermoplasmatota archaeon]
LNPGIKGTGNDHKILEGSDEWIKYRTDKTDMVRESDCIYCNACVTACPVTAISVAIRLTK